MDNNEYDTSRLISFKVPATHLAYANSGQYERVDGKVEISGIQYMFVKRRLLNDTLELMCIPVYKARKPVNAKTDTHPTPSKNFSIDFYTLNDLLTLNNPVGRPFKGASCYRSLLPHIFLYTAEHPPQLVS